MLPLRLFTILSAIIFFLYLGGVHHLLTLQSGDKCEMTFMFQYPQFVKISMAEHVTKAYPQYGLYAYGEGHITSDIRSGKFTGIPVLFVPGSAGSYKQARSLASVSLRKALNSNSIFHLDFFTVNLNEEYSGLNGHVLKTQTEFLRFCVHHIQKLYKRSDDNMTSILVVGHSMGGLITKGLFTDPGMDPNLIKAIVTLATPHVSPIVAFDSELSKYYRDVNQLWRAERTNRLQNITVASIGGGDLDLIVSSGLTFSWEADVSTTALGVPTVWRSVDHLSIVWCKQLVFVIVRMLFDLVDRRTLRLIDDPDLRRDIVRYHLIKRDSGKHFPGPYASSVEFEKLAEWSERLFGQWNYTSEGKERKNFMFRLNAHSSWDMLAIRAVHFFHRDWLFACRADQVLHGNPICTTGENLSNYTFSIPSLEKQWKGAVIPLRPLAQQGYTHILARFPKTYEPWSVLADAFNSKARTRTAPSQLSLANIFKAKRLFRVLNESDYRSLVYTVEFPSVRSPWHAATLYVHQKGECSHDATAKLLVPWSKEERVAYIGKTRKDYLTVGVGSPCPANWEGEAVKVEVHLDSRCTYSISVGSAPRRVLSQMAVTYTPMLLAYATVALLLALRDQFASLSENRSPSMFHVALARGAKPYAILTLARLGSRVAVLRGSGSLPAFLIRMGVPDPDELISSTGTWEQILVPLAIYSCAFALAFVGGLVCLVSVVFWGNISSKLAASVVGRLLKSTNWWSIFSWATTLSDWKSEIWTKLPTVCVGVLLALGYATCSSLAMACGGAIFFCKICNMYEDYLEALISYSLKVVAGKKPISWQGLFEPDASTPKKKDSDDEDEMPDPTEEGFSMARFLRRKHEEKEEEEEEEGEEKRPGLSQISVHITTFMIYVCAFIPCVPALLVWAHNFQFNPRLEQGDWIPPLAIMAVCGLSWIHSFPKPYLRYYEIMCHFLFGVALVVAMYTPLSTYRTPYLIAFTFVVVALHQVLATQEGPPQKRKKNTDQLDLAIVEKILREDEITSCGDIITKPKANEHTDIVQETVTEGWDEREAEDDGKVEVGNGDKGEDEEDNKGEDEEDNKGEDEEDNKGEIEEDDKEEDKKEEEKSDELKEEENTRKRKSRKGRKIE